MKIDITQSALRDWFGGSCRLFFFRKYVEGWEPKDEDISPEWLKGKVFESYMLGASRGGQKTVWPKPARKERSVVDAMLERRAQDALQALRHHGFKIINKQYEIKHGDLVGHVDAELERLGKRYIADFKWTSTAIDDRWRGWADPEEKLEGRFGDGMQPRHYLLIDHLVNKEIGRPKAGFVYIVVSPTWMRILNVGTVSSEGMGLHQMAIEQFREEWKGFKPEPINDYQVCCKCPLRNTCDKAALYPEIEEISL